MRNIQKYAAVFLLLVVLYSCSASKEARSMKQKINGTWMLETITTEGIEGKVKATIFNEASFNCFVGSSWNFVSNNGTGSYNINSSGSECSAIQRLIKWSIYEPKDAAKQFQFKRLDDKRNAMDNGDGFRLDVSGLTDNSMQLKSHITFEGKPAVYVYNFIKK
ncbi:hypothetical protein BH11BAC5_BH11BAC5_05590 [soil metagenome]|jgi:hypothetical protein